jgi:glutamyl endopeptidase
MHHHLSKGATMIVDPSGSGLVAPTEASGGVVNPHTPVSNRPSETAPIEEASQPPSEGEAGEVQSASGEVEAEAEAARGAGLEAAEPVWTPPEAPLEDIGVASFGQPASILETVHGPDDRIEITNTAAYPWRVHASLVITARDNSSWIGTGWFIGPRTLVTAGHCVFIKNSGVPGRDGWVKSIDVMPGRRGSTLPFGSVRSVNFRSVTGWTQSGNEHYDYGAIIIPTELGNQVGWFGYGVYSDADLRQTTVNISGYPGDKPPGTQWYDSHRVAAVDSRKVFYDIDTMGGQSGSAVYRIIDGKRFGVAVHAYGGATTNSGTRISTPVYNNLTTWRG